MSDINRDSPHAAYMRDRSHVKINTWNEAYSGSNSKRCDICLEKWKMEIRDTPSGKCFVCVRGCGKSIPAVEPINSTSTSNTKYSTKYGSASGSNKSFILSKDKKRKKGSLDPESESDLNLFGYSTSGVTLKDEKTSYYENGSWS